MKKITFLTSIILAAITTTAQIINIPADYPTIQQGIDIATTGDTVLVAENIYYENIIFNGKAITVASQFIIDGDTNHINNTVIDGSQPAIPNQGAVVTLIHNEDSSSIISGFTITNGTGIKLGNMRMGGGIACFRSGAKITNNKIINNVVTDTNMAFGGGICCYSDVGEKWIVINSNNIIGNSCTGKNVSAFGGGIYAGSSALIDNNIITNNQCDSEFGNSDGGGVEIENLVGEIDTAYITNNIVSHNSITSSGMSSGGGLSVLFSNSYIFNNTISYNSLTGQITEGGGISLFSTANTIMSGNSISHNSVSKIEQYWGVGVLCSSMLGSTIISDNKFSNNVADPTPVGAGGGLCVRAAFNIPVIVESNLFVDNEAYHGGGFFEKSCYNLILVNNLFDNNHSFRGGAIGMFHPILKTGVLSSTDENYNPRIINNTFHSNSATNDAGAIRSQCDQIPPVIFNCIFYENEALFGNDVYNWRDDTIVISYSNINPDFVEGNWSGVENINEDPIFVNNGDHYCQLDENSPCIDAGNPDTTGLHLPEFDLAGDDRISNGRVDIGAYEWQLIEWVEEQEVWRNESGVVNYPNPFVNSTTIEYRLKKPCVIKLYIFNNLGELVKEISYKNQINGKNPGVIWDAENLPSGIYHCVLKTQNKILTTKMIKLN